LDPKVVEREALRLSPEDRAQLAQKLLLSLDALSEEELENTWLTEANRRARELDRGEVQPIPADEVRRKARGLLR
jgi:putative addiction module component (TIGR02574 family)